jgi:hypothetical protein
MAVFKIVFRFTMIGAFTPAVVLLYTIIDAAAAIVITPWVSMGRPLPSRESSMRRAATVAGLMLLSVGIVNTLLQVQLIMAQSSGDLVLSALRVALEGVPQSFLLGPIGAVFLWGLATAIGWAWVKLRLPSPPAAPPARPVAGARARPAVAGRPASGDQPPRPSTTSAARRPR